jgi:phosphoenolpyruvate carboxykinase (GTP)
MSGLELPQGVLKQLLKIDPKDWKAELLDIKDFFKKFKGKFPKELWKQLKDLAKRLKVKVD